MSLKERIQTNPVIWFLSSVIAAFSLGFTSYRTIVETSDQEIITRSKYEEYEKALLDLSQVTDRLKSCQQKIVNAGLDPKNEYEYTFWKFRNQNANWAGIILLPKNRLLFATAPSDLDYQKSNFWTIENNTLIMKVRWPNGFIEYSGSIGESDKIVNGTSVGHPTFTDVWNASRIEFID